MILGGKIVKKTIQVHSKINSQGAGFSWGIPLRVVVRHLSLA